jgi:hypothetical protein
VEAVILPIIAQLVNEPSGGKVIELYTLLQSKKFTQVLFLGSILINLKQKQLVVGDGVTGIKFLVLVGVFVGVLVTVLVGVGVTVGHGIENSQVSLYSAKYKVYVPKK